jgi:hypothetical protein
MDARTLGSVWRVAVVRSQFYCKGVVSKTNYKCCTEVSLLHLNIIHHFLSSAA